MTRGRGRERRGGSEAEKSLGSVGGSKGNILSAHICATITYLLILNHTGFSVGAQSEDFLQEVDLHGTNPTNMFPIFSESERVRAFCSPCVTQQKAVPRLQVQTAGTDYRYRLQVQTIGTGCEAAATDCRYRLQGCSYRL